MTKDELIKKIKSKLAWKKLCQNPCSNLYVDKENFLVLLNADEISFDDEADEWKYMYLNVFRIDTEKDHIFVA